MQSVVADTAFLLQGVRRGVAVGHTFYHGEVSYTYRFSRYVLDLLRMGNTIKDVALHLHVGVERGERNPQEVSEVQVFTS